MKKAIIYTRVSTDEQAKSGFSLNDQKARLERYCEFNNIHIVAHFQDDYSAKTFGRPEFKKLLEFLNKKKNEVDYLLFLKWDRFSRNAADSYEMIKRLKNLGVTPQAIEQQIDFSIPENKIMFAIYLAAPEVENDRKSINVKQGMRRAKLEGRYLGVAPIGYENARDSYNKPILVLGKKAEVIREVFELASKGIYSTNEIWKMYHSKGISCTKSRFHLLLRSPIYAGKILVKESKDDSEYLVDGIHEAIISEELFSRVQDVLNERKKKNHPKIYKANEALFLRGLLKCDKCGKTLTGSTSKGNGGKYTYYHCTSGCTVRYSAPKVNETFSKALRKIKVEPEVKELYLRILEEKIIKKFDFTEEIKKIDNEISKYDKRLNNLQDKMADGQIEISEYNNIKNRYEVSKNNLILKRSDVSVTSKELLEKTKFCFSVIENLSECLKNMDIRGQQALIGSMFPEKLYFFKNKVRTNRVNEVVKLISPDSAQFERNKKREIPKNLSLSTVVT